MEGPWHGRLPVFWQAPSKIDPDKPQRTGRGKCMDGNLFCYGKCLPKLPSFEDLRQEVPNSTGEGTFDRFS